MLAIRRFSTCCSPMLSSSTPDILAVAVMILASLIPIGTSNARGLADDGIVGPDTLAALNVSLDQRIEQIELNLERWRWLPRDLGERYLMVNMAGFTLEAMEGNETALQIRVIIGKPYRSTPGFP